MAKILLIDTVYPQFLQTLRIDPNSTYEVELQKVLDMKFGTADFYSTNLRKLGWEAIDVIANCGELQAMWQRQIGLGLTQIHHYSPDVVFLQDLNLIKDSILPKARPVIAGQCSCPWPGDAAIKRCDIVYTSFPHYVPRIEKLGVRAVYLPLAFEPSGITSGHSGVLTNGQKYLIFYRSRDCVFIGGVGAPSHWKYGMQVLEAATCEIPSFAWWGYGRETLPSTSQLWQSYRGQAFGRDMYQVLFHSKICLNRHGEVAEGYSNNMRMFEATGCGTMLLTEESKNIRDFFASDECVTYSSPADAVEKIRYYLAHDDECAAIAAKGQRRTVKDHTYEKRMKVVSETLKEMLVAA